MSGDDKTNLIRDKTCHDGESPTCYMQQSWDDAAQYKEDAE